MFGSNNVADFPVCPRCGNTKKGSPVYRCKRCNEVCCEGCRSQDWIGNHKCPNCDLVGFTGPFRTIGRLDPTGYTIITRKR